MKRVALRRVFAWQFALVAALPLLFLAVVWAALAGPEAVRQLEQENLQVSTLIRGQIESVLGVHQRSLGIVAAFIDTPGTTPELTRRLMWQTIEATPAFEALYIADRQGLVEAAAVRRTGGVQARDLLGLDLSARPFYALARDRKALIWSDTFLSPLTGQVTAVLALPVGERLLVADISLVGLSRELYGQEQRPDVAIIVLDGKGRVIVHPDQQLANWQENLRHLPLVQSALAGQPGHGPLRLRGEPWLASAAPVASIGWTVIVAQPRSKLYAPLQRVAWVSGISVLAALALAVGTALRLARTVSERYRRLAAAAQALVDGGRQDVEVDLGSEETHALWERLRQLLDRLQEQEQQAKTAQHDLQAVLDAATEVCVVATGTDGVIRLFNRGAVKMLGWPAQEMIGRCALGRFHDPAQVQARMRELSLRHGRPIDEHEALVAVARDSGYEVRDWTFIRQDRSRLLVSVAVTALRDGLGQTTGFLHIAVDQTERQRAAELEVARERAEAASQAKSEFLSRVSHELRTPLNAMLGYAQLLAMDGSEPLSASQLERVNRIETAGWHLLKLIDDVLDLSRIEAGRMPLATTALDLDAAVKQATRLVAPQAQAQGITLLAPDLSLGAAHSPTVRADATRLRQVLANLLSNAIKYNRRGGHVAATLVDRGDGYFGVKVADTGRGMDNHQLERLFAPFDRLGLEGSDIPGTGIGLVITKRLVELMDGFVEVTSTPDVGSEFTVFLPAAEAPARADEAEAAASAGAAPDVVGHVVYVEDNPTNATLMREVFDLRPGCRLHVCESLKEGRDLIGRIRPRLVLVDLHLPDGSGLDLLNWLRNAPEMRGTPAVVVSADATRSQQQQAVAAGAQAYLTKPLRIAEVLEVVDAILLANVE